MIVGVGIDVVDVARFVAVLERAPALRDRLFTAEERELPAASLAARFAVKEAVAKALYSPGGMRWHDAARTTIGKDWGPGPSLVEGILATIELPVPASKVKAWPLDGRGQRRIDAPLKVQSQGAGSWIAIGPEAKTLWYEIEIGR